MKWKSLFKLRPRIYDAEIGLNNLPDCSKVETPDKEICLPFPSAGANNKIILSKHVSVNTDSKSINLNTLIIGSAGSGKTRYFIKPNILNKPENTSMVVVDLKGLLWEETHEEMEKAGYKVFQLNVKDGKNTIKFNPLNYCKTEEDVALFSDRLYNTITKNTATNEDFWTKSERELLRLIIIYLYIWKNEGSAFCLSDIYDYLISSDITGVDRKKYENIYNSIKKSKPDSFFARAYENIFRLDVNTIEQVVNGTGAAIQRIAGSVTRTVTDTKGQDLHDMFLTKTIVYVYYDTVDISYDFLTSLFITECIKEVFSDRNTRKQQTHVRFVLDEFVRLGNFKLECPEFINYLSEAEFYNASFDLVIQSIDSLSWIYRGDVWEEIISKMGIFLVLGTYDELTNEYISELAGTTTVVTKTKEATVTKKINILSSEEIRNMPDDKILVVVLGQYPILDVKYGYPG